MPDTGGPQPRPDPVTVALGLRPGKVIAVHLNYRSRAAQRGRTPDHPSYFLKPATALAADGDPVELPPDCELLGFEGEIALVIGRPARHVTPDQGWAHVGWVTAANDLGIYDLRYADRGSNLRSKGGDGLSPLGPAFLEAAGLDPARLRVRTWVNGELVQCDDTATLLFPFGELVADLSRTLTLEPGDVILTGTPAGAGIAIPGDTVEVAVDSLDPARPADTGRLATPVVAGSRPLGSPGAPPRVDDAVRAEARGLPPAGAPATPRLDPELGARLRGVAVATLSVQLRRRGLHHVHLDGVRPLAPGSTLVGTARTLRYLPLREDLAAAHGSGHTAQKRVIDTLNPGEVLVMEARGDRSAGTIGDILALRARVRGAAGVVTDGGVRDSAAVAALGLPVFAAADHPAVLGRRHVPWETDIAVACGGATVRPGDVIVGDDDGVIVIPPELAAEVAADAAEQERQETFIAEQVGAGHSVDGLYPLGGEWKERYRSWCASAEGEPEAEPPQTQASAAEPPAAEGRRV